LLGCVHAAAASLTCAHQIEVEYVAFGVGEEKLPLLAEALERNRDISNIPGIKNCNDRLNHSIKPHSEHSS